jgi:hypothetical protein
MAIPHRTAGNPHLERVVTLPARPQTADRGADPRAERRRRRAALATADAAAASPATASSRATGDEA